MSQVQFPNWDNCILRIRFNCPSNSRLVLIDCKSVVSYFDLSIFIVYDLFVVLILVGI